MAGAVLSTGHGRRQSSKTPFERATFSRGIQEVFINYNYQSVCTALVVFTQCCFILFIGF